MSIQPLFEISFNPTHMWPAALKDSCRNAHTYKICAKIDVLRTYKMRAEMPLHIHVKRPLLSDFNET